MHNLLHNCIPWLLDIIRKSLEKYLLWIGCYWNKGEGVQGSQKKALECGSFKKNVHEISSHLIFQTLQVSPYSLVDIFKAQSTNGVRQVIFLFYLNELSTFFYYIHVGFTISRVLWQFNCISVSFKNWINTLFYCKYDTSDKYVFQQL